ncbi:bifunctional helix-turn-helix domain-containing protein/methylated-DNA--[protein]-cysteine S-methyltransferase [Palleronia sp. LCG004]|uniref:bifunctional helix-turn-helix domain-containing protein/methylated-DNA--[protein]-cysteine S-methyltransferase n=1 Tax=Palleronia sp. LCG004 TaxID=3079304 RepID=UPI0029435812|nr:bifunctional helix-turn-helix domain-containing protein/methylated-DNA--[protein]-cysteine S-methyltransferase [Palleronia sp. LCG004]WOI55057.1 bifunctional helix-turn-helix domain-containing protein/methylated-DNA--[protein]-cysteine S-methyltransferase [Palleronia sp. LCG004]
MTDVESSYYWRLMRRAIDRLDAEDGRNLTLAEIAEEMNLAPEHFQRLFSRWIGVSPKRFQQFLTLGHAKKLLETRFTTLDTAHDVGISSTGRLHDLFVRWEAMSPGEYARKGAGLTIRHGYGTGPFGRMLGMVTDRGLCGLAFCEETGDDAALADLAARWPAATHLRDDKALAPHLSSAISPGARNDLHLIGAPFQIKVWEALMTIPTGHVTTYGEIAQAIGRPKAVRAVGSAVGRNPISWIIPCHRAIRATGGLGGYHWGIPVKRAMLAHEAAATDFDGREQSAQ